MLISITKIETAINIWRNIEGVNLSLGVNARCLANVYGSMIYNGIVNIDINDLLEDQKKAFNEAMNFFDHGKEK